MAQRYRIGRRRRRLGTLHAMATFDEVRAAALALPEAEEILTWETDVTFRVHKKIFAIGGEGADRVSIKATPAAQAELIDRDPDTFSSAAYVGRFGWVDVRIDRIDDAELTELLRSAWRATAPKRLVAALDSVADAPTQPVSDNP
jgi:hypothetical protein